MALAIIYFITVVVFAIALLWGKARYSQKSDFSKEDKLISAILPIFGFAIAAQFIYRIYAVVFDEHSWIRFQKTFVLAKGYPLYYGADSGPALATIYGPISVLTYLPATLTSDPMGALRIAEAIAILCFFAPVFWIHIQNSFQTPKLYNFSILIFFCFSALALLLTSLRNAAFTVHADAPTLGLSALACGFIYSAVASQKWRTLSFSAFFAVLAVWSKQVAVPLMVTLPIFILLTDSMATLMKYLLWLLVLGLLISLICLMSYDTEAMIFNMFLLPSQHALKEGGIPMFLKAFSKISRELLLSGFIAAVPLFFIFKHTKNLGFNSCLQKNPWILFLIVSLGMTPLAILSSLKVGGSNNTLSYGSYFFLIATSLSFIRCKNLLSEMGETASKLFLKRYVLLLGTVLTVVLIGSSFYRIATVSEKHPFAHEAQSYIRANLGKSYFPRLTLLHLLEEGKLYHTTDGLMDRHWAGYPVEGKHMDDHFPQEAEIIAFSGEDHKWLFPDKNFPVGYRNVPELSGFVVYKKAER